MAAIFLFGPYTFTGQGQWIPPGGERDFSVGSWPWQGKVVNVSAHGWEAVDKLTVVAQTSVCNSPPSDRYIVARIKNTGNYTVYGYSVWVGGVEVS